MPDAQTQAAIDAAAADQNTDEAKINWDDPAQVAKARGDAVADDLKADTASTEDKELTGKPDAAKPDEAKAKGNGKDAQVQIPKHRFDEVNNERKTLKNKLARLEAEEQVRREQTEREQADKQDREVKDAFAARERELDEMNDRYTELLSENKLDEAKQVRRSISKLEREIARDEAEALSLEVGEQTVEETRLDKVIDRLEANYPEFDPDDKENYNEDLTKMTLRLRKGYELEGMSSSEAMLQAAKDVMGNRPKGKPSSEDANKRAIKRGLKAAEQQGADLDSAGSDADAGGMETSLPDISKLTMDEFEALPEATKKRMRGDERVA